MWRQHATRSEVWKARVGIAKPIFRFALALPDGHDAERLGQILDHDVRSELIEIEPLGERPSERTRRIEEETAAFRRVSLDYNKVGQDLALGCQQGGESGPARGHSAEIDGHEAIEKLAAVDPCHLDDAAVWEKRCFHGPVL